MGLRGPAPKPPDQHANPGTAAAERARMRIVDSDPVPPPPLPDKMPGFREDGEYGIPWPQETLNWWKMWTEDPLTDDYRNSDWLDLLDCALIHGRLWSGDDKAATELRLRMDKHGATKEARAKLRISWAQAGVAEAEKKIREDKAAKVQPSGSSARERIGPLRSVPKTG